MAAEINCHRGNAVALQGGGNAGPFLTILPEGMQQDYCRSIVAFDWVIRPGNAEIIGGRQPNGAGGAGFRRHSGGANQGQPEESREHGATLAQGQSSATVFKSASLLETTSPAIAGLVEKQMSDEFRLYGGA